MEQKLGDKIAQLEQERLRIQHKFNALGYLKLLLLAGFAIICYFVFVQPGSLLSWLFVVSIFAIQVIVWMLHAKVHHGLDHAKSLIGIVGKHQKRNTGEWSTFEDTGAEFIDAGHPYATDLDIVGEHSLFQFLNTTHTWHGRQAFSSDLLDAKYTVAEVTSRQAAVSELASDFDLCAELEYQFSRVGVDASAPELQKTLSGTNQFAKHNLLRVLIRLMPLLTISSGILAVVLGERYCLLVFILFFLIQCISWLIGFPKATQYLKDLQRLPYKLSAYADAIDYVGQQSFTSECLKRIQGTLCEGRTSAATAFGRLAKIEDATSVRGNVLVYFILNCLLLWDFQCALRFSKWRKQFADESSSWFDAIGELESLCCFATLIFVSSHTCMPEITEERCIRAANAGHPLIAEAQRVSNPIDIEDAILIVSGSNMSGKTTYLRTVGINLVLARAGAPVCAERMECALLLPLTSMRIQDDIESGVSTFYAELQRIRSILERTNSERNTIFLIDEIFRGTNSVDRLYGAKAVISTLCQAGAIGMLTTHDLELCEWGKTTQRVKNYSFTEQHVDGKIYFDYTLHEGIATTTNARYLMEQLGIT